MNKNVFYGIHPDIIALRSGSLAGELRQPTFERDLTFLHYIISIHIVSSPINVNDL